MLSQQKIELRILWKELLKTNLKIFKLFEKKWFIESLDSQYMAMLFFFCFFFSDCTELLIHYGHHLLP